MLSWPATDLDRYKIGEDYCVAFYVYSFEYIAFSYTSRIYMIPAYYIIDENRGQN